jgi:predicted short-subunit dehydrogenase-like oxidoreductase (DUF2520 family)
VGSTRKVNGQRSVSIFILGSGKVGAALAVMFRKAGMRCTLRSARKPMPRTFDADLIVLAVRDKQLGELAEVMARSGGVAKRAVCVHVAGALDAEVLSPLRAVCKGVAQMHPMISFADRAAPPNVIKGNARVAGDAAAVRLASRVMKSIGMTPRALPGLNTVGYHAAASLAANTAAALCAVACTLLERSGVPAAEAPQLVAPLLRSVADNVATLGFPQALTGPVRRGDPASIEKQIKLVQTLAPEAVPLLVVGGLAQLPLARAIGEAPQTGFDGIERVLRESAQNLTFSTGKKAIKTGKSTKSSR